MIERFKDLCPKKRRTYAVMLERLMAVYDMERNKLLEGLEASGWVRLLAKSKISEPPRNVQRAHRSVAQRARILFTTPSPPFQTR
ncbi:hypothetical protein SAMN05421853_12212 [Roseivivax halotolerans]|uniref:Uncharacterized protein n=1 Tax=Roseivivax halotolerans TaxID=93684 RepID=A0A1I6AJQ6_9RHOB|nr:hypothetical protein SAMN05421853_12212 [Roseivivax halotolerans]